MADRGARVSGGRVWLDGHLLPAGAPAVPATDLGLRQGLGVFETFRVRDGRTPALDLHLARLVAGGDRLGIAVDAGIVRTGLAALLRDTLTDDVVARVTVTAGDAAAGWPPVATGAARTLVTLHPAPPVPAAPADAVTVPGPRAAAGLADVKTTSYAGSVAAVRAARARGADVALIDEGGEVLEAADGNVLAVRADVLTTPPADGRIVPGVTRGLVLGLAAGLGLAVREAALGRDELATADLVVVSSAVRGLRPLRRLDGVALPGGGDHPLLADLRAGLADLAATAAPVTAEGDG